MKKSIITLLVAMASILSSFQTYAQADELAQLALNIEKLAQFKQILSDLKKGYQILAGGYSTIKNVSEGNFKLHKIFLDGLMEVSPAVKNYSRVADIMNYQQLILKEYKTAYSRFRVSESFSLEELEYIGNVYKNLFNLSLKNLDDLFTIITSSKLRMNDDERLAAIDKIYLDVQDKLVFLRSFNNSNSVLSLQRARGKNEAKTLRQMFNVK